MAAMFRSLGVALAVVVLLVVVTNSAAQVTYTYACNPKHFSAAVDDYDLSELYGLLGTSHGKQQYTPVGATPLYGDAECPYFTSDDACSACLDDIWNNIPNLCGANPIGVTVTSSTGCYLRWEEYSF